MSPSAAPQPNPQPNPQLPGQGPINDPELLSLHNYQWVGADTLAYLDRSREMMEEIDYLLARVEVRANKRPMPFVISEVSEELEGVGTVRNMVYTANRKKESIFNIREERGREILRNEGDMLEEQIRVESRALRTQDVQQRIQLQLAAKLSYLVDQNGDDFMPRDTPGTVISTFGKRTTTGGDLHFFILRQTGYDMYRVDLKDLEVTIITPGRSKVVRPVAPIDWQTVEDHFVRLTEWAVGKLDRK
jgi:hypothetical protein